MAHFLCSERRVLRRPHQRNMGGALADAKTTADEISVMFEKGAQKTPRKTLFSAARRFRHGPWRPAHLKSGAP
jgi:hypothetical protein